MDAYQAGQQLGTLLFGQQPTQGNPDGSPSLFDALSGRVPQGNVYNKTLLTGAQAQQAMMEARKSRAAALIQEGQLAAQQGYKQAYIAAGGDPSLADLATDSFRGATTSNPEQAFALLARGAAYRAGTLGDDATMNRMNSAATGTPLPLSTTAGGITTSNPLTAPVVAPNAVGLATIAAHNAAAQDSLAQAARARAGIGADKASNYDVLPTQSGFVRVNKLTGATDAIKLGDAALQPHEKGGPNASDLRLVFSSPDTDPQSPSYGLPVVDKQALGDFFASGETLPQYVSEHFGSNSAASGSLSLPTAADASGGVPTASSTPVMNPTLDQLRAAGAIPSAPAANPAPAKPAPAATGVYGALKTSDPFLRRLYAQADAALARGVAPDAVQQTLEQTLAKHGYTVKKGAQ